MTIDVTLVTQQLAQARAAYHDLVTGNKPTVVVDQNGERVEYSPASKGTLNAYIEQLQNLLATDPCRNSTGPMRIWM